MEMWVRDVFSKLLTFQTVAAPVCTHTWHPTLVWKAGDMYIPDPGDMYLYLVLGICTCGCLCAHVRMHRCVCGRLILGRSLLPGSCVREPAAFCQVKLFSSPTGGKISRYTPGQLMFNFFTCRGHWMRRGAKSKPLHGTHAPIAMWSSPDRQVLASIPVLPHALELAPGGKLAPNACNWESSGRGSLLKKLLTLKILLDTSK